ncbi:hypothetical protein WMY93_031360 [Mugilogobius chulae]|uniref:Uncharacterized protein n=1 Tax=Mugilogobius chulae TaxID=88201 RepID=A0AAW0MEU4_9GOBI
MHQSVCFDSLSVTALWRLSAFGLNLCESDREQRPPSVSCVFNIRPEACEESTEEIQTSSGLLALAHTGRWSASSSPASGLAAGHLRLLELQESREGQD